jgi:hypothetical protein
VTPLAGVSTARPAIDGLDRSQAWTAAARSAEALTTALADADFHGMRSELAAVVRVHVPGRDPKRLTTVDAAGELMAWRRGWQSCQVLLSELFMTCAVSVATGLVSGIEREGVPSGLDLNVMWERCP